MQFFPNLTIFEPAEGRETLRAAGCGGPEKRARNRFAGTWPAASTLHSKASNPNLDRKASTHSVTAFTV
eukprot:5795428-Pyramimonas_sp.AAC.1